MAATLKAQCNGAAVPSKEYVRLGGRVIAIENAAATPAPALPASGTVQTLTITPPAGGKIYYTIDGTTPTCTTNPSTTTVSIALSTTPTTVKVFASQPGALDSPIVSGTYTLATLTLSVAPSSNDFGYQALGSPSTARNFILTNTGTVTLNATPSTSGEFSIVGAPACSSLSPLATCTVPVQFTPTTLGVRSGQLIVNYGGSNPMNVSLTGKGAGTVLSSSTLNLAAPPNGAGASGQITMSYDGAATQALHSVSVPNGTPFSVSHSCGAGLAPGTQCVIVVTFAPLAAGSWSTPLTIVDDTPAASTAHTVTLNGNTGLSLSPASLDFGSHTLGSQTTATVTLSNTTSATASFSVGSPGGDFAVANNGCPANNQLAGAASCTITVRFQPTAAGTRVASLAVAGALNSVSLTGVGVPAPAISISPTSLAFGTLNVGQSSAPQSVTITNVSGTGGPTISIWQVQTTNPTEFLVSNGCDALAVGAHCIIQVTFAPTSSGARSASLTFNDTSGAHTVSLTAAAQNQTGAPTFSPTTSTVVTNTQVTITGPAGSTIVYTTDGSNPSFSATAHSAPSPVTYTVSSTVDLYALARSAGSADSAIASHLYSTGGITVTPLGQTLTSGQFTTFTESAGSTDSWVSTNDELILRVGPISPLTNECTLSYHPASQTLSLIGDDGYTPSIAVLPSNTVLSNSQCTVNLAGGSALLQGAALTLTIPISFNATYAGSREIDTTVSNQGAATTYFQGSDTIVANSLTLTPSQVTLLSAQSQAFSANAAVNWSFSPAVGTLSSSGLYIAPLSTASQQVVTVTGTSQTDSTKYATAVVTLGTGIPVDLYIPHLTVLSGTPTYRASHSVTADTDVTIAGSAVVTFSAGTTITLGPGFQATAPSSGSATTFHAVIQ
jgi:hypothetical protein